ncbi:hypothetical protein P3T73_08040 [Kiritimatiellota bacterium B12222]|nr:hypothetical protein P3T73_08040 [Kiritimatiellota bacterium B12222]
MKKSYLLIWWAVIAQAASAHEGIGIREGGDIHGEAIAHVDGEAPSAVMGFLWESSYISEGRNNLEEGGLLSTFAATELETTAGVFGFEWWYGSSVETPYTESDFSVSWAKSLSGIDLALGYTYLAFPQDSENDQEYSAEIAREVSGGFTPFFGATYAVEAGGTFIELGVGKEWVLTEKWVFSSVVAIGINEGYVVEGHNGFNNATLGLVASYVVVEHLHIDIGGQVSLPLEKDAEGYPEDEGLEDLYVISCGLTATF